VSHLRNSKVTGPTDFSLAMIFAFAVRDTSNGPKS
jgi:hypothetical protein